MTNKKTFLPILSLLAIVLLSSWGYQGHQKISGGVSIVLPQEMAFLVPAWTDIVRLHASDADYRKDTDPNEGPRHYIDIDNYPEFIFSGRINQDLDSLIAEFGYSFVIDQGVLPWATLTSYDSLVSCFSRHDWEKAGLFAADLGHYVADGHMPMHLTKNYNGQYSGNSGIHSRFESKMVNRFASQIIIADDSVTQIADVPNYVFNYMYQNYPYVDSILQADNHATSVAGNTSSDLYYQTLWDMSESFALPLFQRASAMLSTLIYNAWAEAGKPVMDPNVLPELIASESTRMFQNFPNPFRFFTYIPLDVKNSNTRVIVQIFDATGTMKATVVDEKMGAGYYEIPWDAKDIAEGIYYCILKADDAVMTRKMVVMH
ncbi:T9SS type A sorting domain-containing protein [Bacteroidota bacterium]